MHLPQGSHQESGQAQPSITLSRGSSSAGHQAEPTTRVSLFQCHSLLADKETSNPWHQDAGAYTVHLTTNRWSGKM